MPDIDDRNPENATASRLFDLRTIIGALFVLYGLILTAVGIFDSAEEIAKADGIRINLWLGLSMLALGLLFLLWVRLRPLRVERPPRATGRRGARRRTSSDGRVGVLHRHPAFPPPAAAGGPAHLAAPGGRRAPPNTMGRGAGAGRRSP